MDNYLIRKAESRDKGDIANIYVESWKFTYKGIIPQDFLDGLDKDKYLARMSGEYVPDEVVFEVDGQVAGLAKLIDYRDDDLEDSGGIKTIYFLPQYIGKGYGIILLKWLVEKARSDGLRNIIVWGLSENKRAGRAYKKAGFIMDRTRFIEIGGKHLEETRYIINL